MKKFADTDRIKILDLQKPDSYTDRGRYVVVINGDRKLSGNTEVEALTKSLAMTSEYLEEYKAKYFEILKLCGPLVNYIRPDELDEE
jgi:hypothetical protein